MRFRNFPLLALLLFPSALLPLRAAEQPADYQPARLVHPLETTIPAQLKQLAMADPQVRFNVIVGPKGEMTDYLAVDATHTGLLERAEEKLQEAVFEPASKGGAAASGKITVIVTFFDPEQRAWRQGNIAAPFGGSVSGGVDRRFYATNPESYRLRESKPGELDAPLQMVESKLYRLHAPDAAPSSGQVVAEYFIDHNGRVRLPEIVRSEDEYLSLSVLMSLRETRFAAPTRDGQPTYVRVRQPFNFD
jgi:hypothetical protein